MFGSYRSPNALDKLSAGGNVVYATSDVKDAGYFFAKEDWVKTRP